MESLFQKTGIELELWPDIDMLLMVEKEIIRGKHHAIHKNAKANNKYMKRYYRNKELQYAICLDVNNLDG